MHLKAVYIYTDHNIKTPFLLLCRSPSCCQNSSDSSRHGHHKTSEGAAVSGTKMFSADPLRPASCEVETPQVFN